MLKPFREPATKERSVQSKADISLRILSQGQIQTIHAASLKVLEQTGVAVNDAAARPCSRRRARVEGERARMKAPPVDRALKTATKSIQVYNRVGEPAMRLEGWNSYYGTGSDCPSAIDPDTGRHRRSTKADVGRLALLCDTLGNIDFIMSMEIASDASRLTSYVHQFDASFHNVLVLPSRHGPSEARAPNGSSATGVCRNARFAARRRTPLRSDRRGASYSCLLPPVTIAQEEA